jgi:hypothetical protein
MITGGSAELAVHGETRQKGQAVFLRPGRIILSYSLLLRMFNLLPESLMHLCPLGPLIGLALQESEPFGGKFAQSREERAFGDVVASGPGELLVFGDRLFPDAHLP